MFKLLIPIVTFDVYHNVGMRADKSSDYVVHSESLWSMSPKEGLDDLILSTYYTPMISPISIFLPLFTLIPHETPPIPDKNVFLPAFLHG